jgi:hypothetical protein
MNGESITADRDALLHAISAISDSGTAEATAELDSAAAGLGTDWAFGRIHYAGQWAPTAPTQFSPGDFAVTFAIDQGRTDTGVYASAWPKWAYNIAKAALVANKRVLVTYAGGQGGPFGQNLQFVTLSAL